MDVVLAQVLAGQPHVLRVFIDDFTGGGVDLLPGFATADHVYRKAFAVVVITVGNVVDPPELLLARTPALLGAVSCLARFERLDLFPNRG